jgi:RNA polymerase sigma factor (sigma-70 family)
MLESELPRAFPRQLRHLLDAAAGPEQERAWADFLAFYSRLILHVARGATHDHDVAMDRYAYALERLREQDCRRLRSFAADGRGKFTTWLVVVVRRLCLDHDRHKHGRAPAPGPAGTAPPRRLMELLLDPESMDRLPDGKPPTDEVFDQVQLHQRLEAALATLSPGDRLLLSLRYEDERSAREIASLLFLPTPFHVYRRLNRVHDSLRQALTARADRPAEAGSAGPDAPAVQ